jgi:sugar lactone lactonase YvrE
MRRLARILAFAAAALLALAAVSALLLWLRYGGGEHFEDRTSDPTLPASALEVVVDLDLPPGNIAVSAQNRIFFTFHPEASPDIQVAEIVNGEPVAFPSGDLQPGGEDPLRFQSVLSLRIDRQGRLWTLDNANHGLGQPRLLAFDPDTREIVHHHDFPREIAPLGSHLNDFQVNPEGTRIYIADASIAAKRPALVVYDLETQRARRLLEGHVSVEAEPFVPVVQGREMLLFGIVAIRPGVDSIALDRRGQWLYYASVTAQNLYRIRTRDLDDEALSPQELAARVEVFAAKTMSDGITTDFRDNVYLSDLENSAILRLGRDRNLVTLLKDPVLRWPDGFSFGPGGWLYVTCSALHHVIGRSADHVRAHAPYQIYRFQPGVRGVAGH